MRVSGGYSQCGFREGSVDEGLGIDNESLGIVNAGFGRV